MSKVVKLITLSLVIAVFLVLVSVNMKVYADCQCGDGWYCDGSCMGYTCEGHCKPKPQSCSSCSVSCPGCACNCDGSCGDESCDDEENPPAPTATPAPWRVQGLRVRLSDFGDNTAIASQPVTVNKVSDPQLRSSSSASPFTIADLSKVVNQPPTPPYTVGETILNNTYSSSVSVPTNWDVFSTWCKNKTDCHTVSSPRTGNPVNLDLGREGGYADLWWHFVAPPSNLKALCNKYGTAATLSWSGPSDIASYPIRVDKYETPNNIPLVCDPNSTGPTNVCRDISGTSTTITVDKWANYGWWLHSGYFWNAVASSSFRCNQAPSAHVYIQPPNCARYPGEYSWETPIEFDGYASAQGGIASSDIFIAKKCGNSLCEYPVLFPSNWCESAGGTMQFNATTQMGTFCKIKTANFSGTDTWPQHFEASWKPNETGTYYAVINAKSSNPADFMCSGNPRCEYSDSTLDKYGPSACEDGRYASCQLGGEEGKVAYPIVGGGGANLWGESIEFQVRTTEQCVIPRMNITVKNKEGTPAPVPYQSFTYACAIWPQCYSDAVLSNVSSSSPRSIATWPGGAGISLSSNQILLGVTPNPAGGSLNTKNNNRAAPAPAYDRATWNNYWWNPYPDVPLRSVNFVVATHTPTPTNTPTPTTVPQLKVTGAIQQRTGKVGSYIYRNVIGTNSLPFVNNISVNNKTHWTISPYTTTVCATPAPNMNIVGGVKVGYIATYTFPAFTAGKGYCVPQVVTASGFKLPVEVTVLTSGMPTSYSLLSPYKVDVTTTNPTVLNIPFRFNGEEWIRLKDTSFTRPVAGNITNKIPYIVDKFLIGTATQGNINTGDTDDALSLNMISENVAGTGGFIPYSVTLDGFNKPSTNGWKLPNGYMFNSSGLTSGIDKFVAQVLKTQGYQKVTAASTLTLSPGTINVIPPGSSVGQINISGGTGAAVLIASSDAGVMGNLTITTGTNTGSLLVIANNITVGPSVAAMNGVYVAKGNMNLSGGGNPFKIKGNVVTGGGMINLRSRSDKDHARPSMFIQFDYEMYQKLVDIIGVVGSGG